MTETTPAPFQTDQMMFSAVGVARQRQFSLYSPYSRPTSHLRCGQVEVRGISLFRATSDTSKPVLFRATHTIERKTAYQ